MSSDIAMTRRLQRVSAESRNSLQRLYKVIINPGDEQEYDGNYLIQVSQENYNLEAFVLVSQCNAEDTDPNTLIIMGAMILAIMVIVLFVFSVDDKACRRDEQHYHADQGRRNPASGAARRMVSGIDYAGYGI